MSVVFIREVSPFIIAELIWGAIKNMSVIKKSKTDQKFANLILEIFKATVLKIKVSRSKKWLKELIEWTDRDNILFQAIEDYELCDVKTLRNRIKKLSQERLAKLSTCKKIINKL